MKAHLSLMIVLILYGDDKNKKHQTRVSNEEVYEYMKRYQKKGHTN